MSEKIFCPSVLRKLTCSQFADGSYGADYTSGYDTSGGGSSDIVNSLFNSALSIGANAAQVAINDNLAANAPIATPYPTQSSFSAGISSGTLLIVGLLALGGLFVYYNR